MVAQAPKSPDFRLTTATRASGRAVGAADSAEGVRFKTAVTEMYAVDVAARAAGFVPPKQALDLARVDHRHRRRRCIPPHACRGSCSTASCCPSASAPKFDPVQIDEIMNYPRFDLPMYKPLVDLNSD